MSERDPSEVRGEHALRVGEKDRLGFTEVAGRIAKSIVDRASADGLVIGLDGDWGSGKSSLLHLIERKVGALSDERRPTIISFRPWLVGNRDALLSALFGDLADKIAAINVARGTNLPDAKKRAAETAAKLRKFAHAMGRAGDLVEAAGVLWAPLGYGGKALKALRKVTEKKDKEVQTDLAALKRAITADLTALGHRFIVTVDDVDRLEPAEVIEVLRLVRSVADFPNIVYLLCYDVDRLAEAIENGADIEDGKDYLEKIVQLTVMVPKPEPFELRQWFAEELADLLGPVEDELGERLKLVIDQEGANQLRTPRAVVRTLDSIRFFWPALRDESVDIADLVWLQLVKDGAPGFYRWVESYVASMAATSFGTATVSEVSQKSRLKELGEALPEGQLGDMLYRSFLAQLLPGLQTALDDEELPISIYREVPDADRKAAIAGRRLASPDHYRFYFSLIGPSHAISQQQFDQFWSALDSGPKDAATILLDLHGQGTVGSLRKSDVLIERLRGADQTVWSDARPLHMLLAFGHAMDDIHRRSAIDRQLIMTTTGRAERLVPILFARLAPATRHDAVEQLFGAAPDIGWLTILIRTETFAHGKYGQRRRPADEWILSAPEFDQASALMLARYRRMGLDEILETPRPLSLLFGWNQLGDADGPRKLIASATVSDADFLAFLTRLMSQIDSSDGRFTVLKRENIDPFLDYDGMRKRLDEIVAGADEDHVAAARALIAAAEVAKNF